MSLFIAIIALSFLIFFHELGHFLAARIFGVKVETFSIGFGPKLLSFYHKDIQYCLSAIPLGGYVKMKGEIQSESQGISQQPIMQKSRANDSLQDKHPYQRIIILLAGPFFNFLFAFLLYCFFFVCRSPIGQCAGRGKYQIIIFQGKIERISITTIQ